MADVLKTVKLPCHNNTLTERH